jgi:hypothetical protein
MRKLKSLRQVLEDAENEGIGSETLMVDPDDVVEIDEDTLEALQNPTEDTEEEE